MPHFPAGDADIAYAGFWRRCAAFVIDALILSVCFYAVLFAIIAALALGGAFAKVPEDHVPGWMVLAYFGLVASFYACAAAYYSLQESSAHQATLGKRALGIKVTDAQGRRLTRRHALGRWFAAALSYLTFYIGFLLAAFTERKRALHDMVAQAPAPGAGAGEDLHLHIGRQALADQVLHRRADFDQQPGVLRIRQSDFCGVEQFAQCGVGFARVGRDCVLGRRRLFRRSFSLGRRRRRTL